MSSECTHDSVDVAYDSELAKKMPSATEVRQKYPRFDGTCPDCGTGLIKYASFEHYIMGDW